MRNIDIDEKADDLKAALRNLVDAAVDMERAEAKLCALLPTDAVAAIVTYVRTEHVSCPACGMQTTAAVVANTDMCAECWETKRLNADA